VRLNRYAPCPDPAAPDAPEFPESGHLGVHHHTDAGALTILYQDTVAGLQAMHKGHWHTVEPIRGALTVNLGDMLQVWSNDRYRSPLHRVIVHRDRARCSAPFFLNPSYETVCEPLPGLLAGNVAPRFKPISWAHFRDQRSAGDYADYGAEIQIDDYRLSVS
jgi:isopenicillin N synthase-like dioxygenase